MADVFISYARENNGEASLLEMALKEAGFSVWRDSEISPRKTWDTQIEREIRAAKAVIVLWTPHSARSEWVRIEAEFARREEKLIPTLFHTCDIPIAFSLIQAVDLRGWHMDEEDRWNRLVGAINELVHPPTDDDSGDGSEINIVEECKWTGWHTQGASIIQNFRYKGSSYNFEMSFDWVTEKSGIRIPGMPVMTLRMFFIFLSIPLDSTLSDVVLQAEDGRKTGLMPAKTQQTDTGGAIIGFLARSDADKAFEWLARGDELVITFLAREEQLLMLPVPFSPGLREQYDALRKRLR